MRQQGAWTDKLMKIATPPTSSLGGEPPWPKKKKKVIMNVQFPVSHICLYLVDAFVQSKHISGFNLCCLHVQPNNLLTCVDKLTI